MFKERPSLKRPKLVWAIVAAIIAVLLAVIGFLVWQIRTDSRADTGKETTRIIKQIAVHYELPRGEDPTVAKVQDTSKLADQPFFDKAQNGDYLVVYEKAKLAILYRESADKLINVGPINIKDDGTTSNEGS